MGARRLKCAAANLYMYDVRIYKNTGLNSVNIIDDPDSLDSVQYFDHIDVPSLDVLTNIELTSIKVKGTKQQLEGASNVRIGNQTEGYFYYIVTGAPIPLSPDVWLLDLTPDYITSAGGMSKLTFLDGIVTRSHVDSDEYGEWCIEDELLVPSEPLELEVRDLVFCDDPGAKLVLIEATVDLNAMACIASSNVYLEEQQENVSVPSVLTNLAETVFAIEDNAGAETKTLVVEDSELVEQGINNARSLGVEDAITSKYVVPAGLVTKRENNEFIAYTDSSAYVGLGAPGSPAKSYTLSKVTPLLPLKPSGSETTKTVTAQIITKLTGKVVDTDTNISFEYAEVKNNRVLYGSLNKIGILTNAGNRLETNPENIKGGDTGTVMVRTIADPHPTGSPYHRFLYMNGDSSIIGFWRNAVKGLQWKQLPLRYDAPSGNALNRISIANSRALQDLSYAYSASGLLSKYGESLAEMGDEWQTTGRSVLNRAAEWTYTSGAGAAEAARSALGGSLDVVRGGIKNFTAAMGTGSRSVGEAISGAVNAVSKRAKTYNMERAQELQQFAISQNVVSPYISISYDGEALRDFYDEAVIVYRYRPTDRDIARFDKILTMYGYKTSLPIGEVSFDNRQYFNYIQANVSVGGQLPQWWCNGVADQIGTGVRVWHVKPDPIHYNDNPIRS